MRNLTTLILAAAGVLSCTTPAAARYGYCYVGSYGGDRIFLSGTMDFGEDSENYLPARNDFSGAVNRPVNRIECEGHFARAHEADDQRKRKIEFERAVIEDTGWTGRYAAALRVEKPKSSGAFISVKDTSAKSAPLSPSAPSRYVEVAGPNGTIRLSPEVAARNQAAAEEYRRKMEAHARDKADHDRKMTEYQESRARAGRALGDHAAQLRAQQDEHQRQLREHAARVERDSDSPCARYRRSKGDGWKVNPCV